MIPIPQNRQSGLLEEPDLHLLGGRAGGPGPIDRSKSK
jgi:hypothetical protein